MVKWPILPLYESVHGGQGRKLHGFKLQYKPLDYEEVEEAEEEEDKDDDQEEAPAPPLHSLTTIKSEETNDPPQDGNPQV